MTTRSTNAINIQQQLADHNDPYDYDYLQISRDMEDYNEEMEDYNEEMEDYYNNYNNYEEMESNQEMENYDERMEHSFCILPEDHEIPREDFDHDFDESHDYPYNFIEENAEYEYPDKHDDVDLSNFTLEESETIIRISLKYGMLYSDVIYYSTNCTNCVGKLCVWTNGCNGLCSNCDDELVGGLSNYTTEEYNGMVNDIESQLPMDSEMTIEELKCEFDDYLNQYEVIGVNNSDVEQYPNQFIDQRIDTIFANYHRGQMHSTSCLSFDDTKCSVCEQLIAKNERYIFKWGAQCCNECSHKLNECFMSEGEILDLNDKWESDMTKYDCRRVFGMPTYTTLCNYSHLKKQ